MDAQGSRDMVHVKTLFAARARHNLIPDQSNKVVTGGLGEFNGMDYLAAAMTSDGSTLIAYMPTPRTVMVDLSKLRGAQVQGWWYDPRTGVSTAAGSFPTSGPIELAPPGDSD